SRSTPTASVGSRRCESESLASSVSSRSKPGVGRGTPGADRSARRLRVQASRDRQRRPYPGSRCSAALLHAGEHLWAAEPIRLEPGLSAKRPNRVGPAGLALAPVGLEERGARWCFREKDGRAGTSPCVAILVMVAKRPTFTPDQLKIGGNHLLYEVQMFCNTAALMEEGGWEWGWK